ncbi:hypothetical protein LLG95_05920 [bacterium]|nr:hypothetical protein [bacterium]
MLILFLFLVFSFSRPRPDQAAPPAGVLSFKPAADPVANPSAQSQESRAIFDKWVGRHKDQRNWNDLLAKHWRPGQRLTAEQTQWLLDHRDLVDDLLRLAAAGGIPGTTCEQYSALSYRESQQMLNPITDRWNEILHYPTILAAESQRRYDAGDLAGAVDALLAINTIARSVREPLLINHLVAIAMQSKAGSELAAWISDSRLTPELAQRLRGKFAADAITMSDYRRTLDAIYCNGRNFLVDGLTNNNFRGLLTYNFEYEAARNGIFDSPPSERKKSAMAKVVIFAAGRSIWMRATPQSSLDSFDAAYRESAKNNAALPPELSAFMRDEREIRVRTNTSLAKVNLNVAGLDALVGNQSSSQTDPFTNQPLKTVDSGDSTLIYSLGPDGIDQHGALSYDPTNGTISSGDIVLRVTKRPQR